MGKTSIAWTDWTVNPIRVRNRETGAVGHFCEKVSPGCAHCYASAWNSRVRPTGKHLIGTGLTYDQKNRDKVELFLDASKFAEVLKRRKPTKFFWCDMTDLFGEWVPDEWIDQCFAVMALTPQHTHQILTKRPERMRRYLTTTECVHPGAERRNDIASAGWTAFSDLDRADEDFLIQPDRWPLPNVWLGVSCENQETADARIPHLKALADAGWLTFVSYEPALGPVDWTPCAGWLRWWIAGGESGAHARPCDIGWIRAGLKAFQGTDTARFVKQLGVDPGEYRDINRDGQLGWFPLGGYRKALRARTGDDPSEWPEDLRIRQWPEG